MEEWWTKNEKFLSDQQMTFAGHVCITALTLRDDDDTCVKERYGRSYHAVCELIEQHSPPSGKGFRASMSTKNIVLFGGTGAGKSSVVNLMAGQEKARTSLDMGRCTLRWQEHPVTFDGFVCKVFDTVGLEEPQLGTKAYLDIIVDAYNLIRRLKNEGGIDLLLYCVRAGPVTSTLQTNYRLFYEWLCENKVPIVLVLTGLENEQDMEDWWTRNEHVFSKYQIHVDGHACITAANHVDGRRKQLYEESRSLVRHLVIQHTQGSGGAWNGGEGLLTRFIRKLKELLQGKPKTKDVISVLTDRCGMPLSAAKALVKKVV
ncbi:hypothetical protein M405DRAFT_793418 [Rhizopogon salebrosus TDB-379]|nr:hypothetical protein M405DRAFT_793418 [Rhizopogon salebrosus TDB-379]